METRVITAHVPIPLAEKLDMLADRYDRSRAWVVKQALDSWIEDAEERYRSTLEAMEDAEAGNVVDNDEAVAWIKSLSTAQPLPMPVPQTRQ